MLGDDKADAWMGVAQQRIEARFYVLRRLRIDSAQYDRRIGGETREGQFSTTVAALTRDNLSSQEPNKSS